MREMGSAQPIGVTIGHRAGAILFCLLISSLSCFSADVVFVRSPQGLSPQLQEIKIAADFYGLNLNTLIANPDDLELRTAIHSKSTVAVTIAADALPLLSQQTLTQELSHRPSGSVPVLILGVTPETDGSLLTAWSSGTVKACRNLERTKNLQYVVGKLAGVTEQLTGLEASLNRRQAAYLDLNNSSDVRRVAMIRNGGEEFPVFIQTVRTEHNVFIDCLDAPSSDVASAWNTLAAIAPALMFIRYSAGERGWHAVHHYANLTIDDPWLREPYGFLDYGRLLIEMEQHNFHSTIAFIPWNYDRSQPQVVSLIREHPDRFSISIHGDNHDHKEFTDYASKSLALQKADLGQALARMDRFETLTGLPYDKVMIFPHSIAPEKTLAALKDENYLATVNSSNVPMDTARPAGASFDLRATTLAFAGFSSIRRYSVEGSLDASFMALNMFLDNPSLFYCHQEFFSSGIGAFDAQADYVNRVQPDTRWRSLGEIVKHLYLVKLRDDDNYDVLSFSSMLTLENSSNRDALFYVKKQENEHPALVTVNHQSWPYTLRDGYLEMQVPIPSGRSKAVAITYRSDPQVRAMGIEKRSLRVYCLRMASDFRDIAVARFALGRSFIRLYNENGQLLKLVLLSAFVLLASCAFGAWRIRTKFKTYNVGQRPIPFS